MRSNGYAFQVEMAYRTVMVGGRVREIPIRFTDRTRGSSKMSSGVILEALALPWRVRSSASGLEALSRTVSSESGRR